MASFPIVGDLVTSGGSFAKVQGPARIKQATETRMRIPNGVLDFAPDWEGIKYRSLLGVKYSDWLLRAEMCRVFGLDSEVQYVSVTKLAFDRVNRVAAVEADLVTIFGTIKVQVGI